MKTIQKILILTIVSIMACSCAKTREKFKLDETSPDESQVVPYPDLTIPPNFGLKNPASGFDTKYKNHKRTKGASKGESAILNKIGVSSRNQ